jgi:hypothetical protein
MNGVLRFSFSVSRFSFLVFRSSFFTSRSTFCLLTTFSEHLKASRVASRPFTNLLLLLAIGRKRARQSTFVTNLKERTQQVYDTVQIPIVTEVKSRLISSSTKAYRSILRL